MISRIGVSIILLLLAILHIAFAITNFGFVDGRGDLNVLAEGIGAAIAGIALLWAAVQLIRGIESWRPLLIAGAIFVSTMIISIATDASDPPMLLVSLVAPLVAVLGLTASRRGSTPRVEPSSRQ